jgi:hypothetical protein
VTERRDYIRRTFARRESDPRIDSFSIPKDEWEKVIDACARAVLYHVELLEEKDKTIDGLQEWTKQNGGEAWLHSQNTE